MAITREELRRLIKTELPTILRDDPEMWELIWHFPERRFADRVETEDRFEKMLAELKLLREEQAAKWAASQAEQADKWAASQAEQADKWAASQAEQADKWAASQAEQADKWEANQAELVRMREEQAAKWEANQAELVRMREEQAAKWEANQAELVRLREEQAAKWEANQAELKLLHEEVKAVSSKIDRSIGALGARWGIKSERSFRNALTGILEKSFGVQVLNINEWDDEGIVFGRPDQVEIDVIIKNGLLILCELKSSLSKPEMLVFQRKALFYERRHGRKPNRLLAISPMIDDRARQVAESSGIEMYSDSLDVGEM